MQPSHFVIFTNHSIKTQNLHNRELHLHFWNYTQSMFHLSCMQPYIKRGLIYHLKHSLKQLYIFIIKRLQTKRKPYPFLFLPVSNKETATLSTFSYYSFSHHFLLLKHIRIAFYTLKPKIQKKGKGIRLSPPLQI